MSDARAVEPLREPPDATVVVPGSKSLTNRALVLAALAEGESHLLGALVADDTEAMAGAVRALGAQVDLDPVDCRVVGVDGRPASGPLSIDARLSGTTSRFVLPLLMLGPGPYELTGGASLLERPMGPTLDAMRRLGAQVDDEGSPGHLPVVVTGSEVRGDGLVVDGSTSSQFTSGLLLAAAAVPGGLTVELAGDIVSRPYLDMTVDVLRAFGVEASRDGDRRYHVRPGGLRAATYRVEPDASAASYFFAAAAICGGQVRVEGLGTASVQGDAAVVEVLERMGAEVTRTDTTTEVRGTSTLRGIDVDLTDMPDMAQTIAAVAVFADGPTRVRGVSVIRGHETDRIRAVVTELHRCGIDADEHDDGFTVHPGTPTATTVATYHDHRMAMSFALLGLRAPGIAIADPGCVAKTFPDFFEVLDQLRVSATPADN